ncbi:hypothetical protein [Riemerella anatipestifer]|uniref:hypothetical protein n=1 Tax=Riemerella anatipestifer TaxID=34085 RepID=UPI0021D58355|nr:hypothetical protein [Riemerella anatipestifer]MCW0517923.1 hypothetical protein [Riemerella anatipestifer]
MITREGRLDLANRFISNKIRDGVPFMVGRYGSIEAETIVNFLEVNKKQNDIEAIIRHIRGELNVFWKKDKKLLNKLCFNAGFFPNEEDLVKDFVNLMIECSKDIDGLGVWNGLEEYIPEVPLDCSIFKLRELEPWFFNNPWTSSLKGKKVLVIHPFEDSIRYQYEVNRTNLYKNENILPEFDLKIIKAVQSIANEKVDYLTWFDALEDMKNKIDLVDFDVAIIGCGAYGLPLASYIKNKGKQAIHLGGVTQLLFGIKGARWEGWNDYLSLRKENGTYWIRPRETPKGYNEVEGGCYW